MELLEEDSEWAGALGKVASTKASRCGFPFWRASEYKEGSSR